MTFTFDWKVSSESGFDYLTWYLDGSQQDSISGTGYGWRTVTCLIPSGTHTIKWEYSKDESAASGEDCGRHTMMLDHFRSVGGWRPPEKGTIRAENAAKDLEYIPIDRVWQIPIRLLAVDDGVKYKVRARLREKKNVDRSMGRVADKYGFAAGLRVRWLPKAASARSSPVTG